MKHIKILAHYLQRQKSYSSLDLCSVYLINRARVGLVMTKRGKKGGWLSQHGQKIAMYVVSTT